MVGNFGATLGNFGVSLGSLWGLICVIRAILEAYVSHFEKLTMAHVCRERSICPILRPIERDDHCLGPKTRINIYVDARFGPQKPAQGMIFTTPEAQDAHQHLC